MSNRKLMSAAIAVLLVTGAADVALASAGKDDESQEARSVDAQTGKIAKVTQGDQADNDEERGDQADNDEERGDQVDNDEERGDQADNDEERGDQADNDEERGERE